MTKKPTYIGNVIIHAAGTNPYMYARDGAWIGDARVKLLRDFRDTGTMPVGYVLWDDRDREPITSPDQIDWAHLRD